MIERELIDALAQTRVTKEDGLFTDQQVNQGGYLTRILSAVKPNHILEVGTLCGHFCYLALDTLPAVKIDTVDVNPASATAVSMLNNRYRGRVNLIIGDSLVELPTLNGPYDFAWIDGAHDREHAEGDLYNCSRLRIPDICVDDTVFPEVGQAVLSFLATEPYEAVSASADNRGIVHLRRNV